MNETDFEEDKKKFVNDGFRHGFSLNYQNSLKGVRRTSKNLHLRVGSATEMWNKVMKEVQLKRVASPFEKVPFEEFIQSPIGLVLKDEGKKTRIIFHLSHPRDGVSSVNAGIPKEKCSVRYPDFEEAVALCISVGKTGKIGKTDLSSAFRHVPMSKDSWPLLVMMAVCPLNNKIYYFVDKCLPFGSSISCSYFQKISDAIAAIVRHKTKKDTVNYLDDFFFAAILKYLCDQQIEIFVQVCKDIKFPVTVEKTFWGSGTLVFLGLLLDMVKQLVCIPAEKVEKAIEMVDYFLQKDNKKVTVLQIQKLCRYLNFLCRCLLPG